MKCLRYQLSRLFLHIDVRQSIFVDIIVINLVLYHNCGSSVKFSEWVRIFRVFILFLARNVGLGNSLLLDDASLFLGLSNWKSLLCFLFLFLVFLDHTLDKFGLFVVKRLFVNSYFLVKGDKLVGEVGGVAFTFCYFNRILHVFVQTLNVFASFFLQLF